MPHPPVELPVDAEIGDQPTHTPTQIHDGNYPTIPGLAGGSASGGALNFNNFRNDRDDFD